MLKKSEYIYILTSHGSDPNRQEGLSRWRGDGEGGAKPKIIQFRGGGVLDRSFNYRLRFRT